MCTIARLSTSERTIMRATPRVGLSLISVTMFGLAWPSPAAAGGYNLIALASFNDATGHSPEGSVVRDAQGNFYGTTTSGGANGLGGSNGAGTVWELAAGSSTITALASFNGPNGSIPGFIGLVRDAQG